jgi:hypothetical protein
MGAAASWRMCSSRGAGSVARLELFMPLGQPASSRVRVAALKAFGQRRWEEELEVPPRATNSTLQQPEESTVHV